MGEALGAYLALNEVPSPSALQRAAATVQQALAAPGQLLEQLLDKHGPDALLPSLAVALPGTPAPALRIAAACILAWVH